MQKSEAADNGRKDAIDQQSRTRWANSELRLIKSIVLALVAQILFLRVAWAWFAEGHEIVAVIAADDLTPIARSHVAQILGVPADTRSVEKAMAAASILPDTEFRDEDRATAQWHFIDICLQDKESDLPGRCPQGNCITARIDEYARRLRDGIYDKWAAAGDLAFLIHLVGDIHQPLHTTTNADRGGTCQQVNVAPAEQNLHYAWDDAVVIVLEKQLGTHDPDATARRLETLYPATGDLMTWKPGESERIAWSRMNWLTRTFTLSSGYRRGRARFIPAIQRPGRRLR